MRQQVAAHFGKKRKYRRLMVVKIEEINPYADAYTQ